MQDMEKMTLLIDQLNTATKQYDIGEPIMSDEEWDNLYFSLQTLERETGYAFPNSPTQKVVYQVVNQLNKVKHNHAMLSLDKTKDLNEIEAFVGDKVWVAMMKLDGLTCSLTYENGYLVAAETRGNGEVGEDILHNAQVIRSIPKRIAFLDRLVIDGEIICTEADFKEFEEEYKNPRNFAAGSIRLLDSKECESRHLSFVAWDVIEGLPNNNSFVDRLLVINTLGFYIVPTYVSQGQTLEELVSFIQLVAHNIGYPIDGVVFKFNDVAYGKSLGQTSHHFKNAIAYKFYDEIYKTQLLDIEWTMGRTGVLTPVAVFAPVEIDGSIIERANLHNVSVMETILGKPFKGQNVYIYKANQIIPQIKYADNTNETEVFYIDKQLLTIPKICPVCGQGLQLTTQPNSIRFLRCINSECEGKIINKLDHFCGKKGLDIKGISKATLEKLIEWGWINCLSDIFKLYEYRDEWIKKPGFGVKSVDKILNSINAARNTTLEQFISSLGIPFIGQTISKDLVKVISTYEEFRDKAQSKFNFAEYPGFAGAKTLAIWNYDFTEADKIYPYLIFEQKEEKENIKQTLDGITVCITGKLHLYKNRAALQAEIEAMGGKVSSSVSKNTNYLINNDNTSTSSKNLTAKKLGVNIITEQEFVNQFLTK